MPRFVIPASTVTGTVNVPERRYFMIRDIMLWAILIALGFLFVVWVGYRVTLSYRAPATTAPITSSVPVVVPPSPVVPVAPTVVLPPTPAVPPVPTITAPVVVPPSPVVPVAPPTIKIEVGGTIKVDGHVDTVPPAPTSEARRPIDCSVYREDPVQHHRCATYAPILR